MPVPRFAEDDEVGDLFNDFLDAPVVDDGRSSHLQIVDRVESEERADTFES